jgi:hypothetical protein
MAASIYYYEHLASGRDDDPVRQAGLRTVADKLKASLHILQKELGGMVCHLYVAPLLKNARKTNRN